MNRINPYIEKTFEEWFKRAVTAFLIFVFSVVLIVSLINHWIDKELSLQIGFMLLGAILGAWLSDGKI